MVKVLFAGNGQIPPLAEMFERTVPGLECTAVEVWKMSAQECAAVDIDAFDIIVAQPLHSDRYGAISLNNLTQARSRKPVHFIHNLHFEGPLPDCTYLGKQGNRVSGPLGTYHSKTVVWAFRHEKSVEDCLSAMRRGAGIVPLDAWIGSASQLRSREENVTVPFADELLQHTLDRPCFHVFNHPTPFLLARYAEKILGHVLDQKVTVNESQIPDRLAFAGSWPTYEYLATALGLRYPNETFMMPKISPDPVPLKDFIEMCFEAYAKIGPDALTI